MERRFLRSQDPVRSHWGAAQAITVASLSLLHGPWLADCLAKTERQ
jgi:hypothetical protein